MLLDFEIPQKEIKRRRQVIRDIWDYKKTDHIPVMMQIVSNPFGYTLHEELFSHEKQLQLRLASLKRTLELVPDDYIPVLSINAGCVGIESALGMELYYGEHEDQLPAIKEYLFDGFDGFETLKHIDPKKDGILPDFLDRIRYFTEQTNFQIPVTCLDMNGPMAIAMNIVGSDQFLLGMYTEPERVTQLLDFVMDNIILMTDACIEAAGGVNNLACTDFTWEWFPEGKKGHVSDDVSAMVSPEMFQKFSIPVNNRIYQKYGPGTLHNCGPNPCAGYYLEHTPNISGADLNFKYSKNDLPSFKKPFAHRGIIYLGMEYTSDEQTLADYQYIIDSLAPDVIAMPSIFIDEKFVDAKICDVGKLYEKMLKMSKEYAKQIWG